MRKMSFWAGLALALFVAMGPATVRADENPRVIRILTDDDGTVRLQTSILTFRNAEGATVDLIGAIHVGDRSYYETLNEIFKGYDAVLYEMVKPAGMPAPRPNPNAKPTSMIHALQRFIQNALELQFQLDVIDYRAKNFVHADLDVDTFTRLQDERGESMFSLMLNSMLRQLSNPKLGENAPSLVDIIKALQSDDRARELKLLLARQFADVDAMTQLLEGPGGSVILSERNKHALKVAREEIAAGRRRIAVFFGAGHLPGMEELLVDLMGFEPVGEPQWVTAWTIEPATPAATPRPAPAEENEELHVESTTKKIESAA